MKIFKLVMRGIILTAIICAVYLCGVYSTKYQQNREENKSTITMIAVVNADVGTEREEENVFYASELMYFPDTNFETASLTEAREGIESDRYAAYVVIPGSFSTSVESVNEKPLKSQITYSLNENLRQDVQRKVVNDIHNFILNLSTNVSYMYVDAILKEMHAVQDDSNSIMKNDVKDLEAIEEVESADLMEEVEYDPFETVETEIEYMDLSDDYQEVDDAADGVYTTYTTNISDAQNEFLKVKEEGSSVGEQALATAEVFSGINILTDGEENLVYADGMEHLGTLAGEFEELVNSKKFTAKERLGFKEGDPEPEPEPELPEGEVRVYLSKADLLNAVDRQIEFWEKVKEELYEDESPESGEEGDGGGEGEEESLYEIGDGESSEETRETSGETGETPGEGEEEPDFELTEEGVIAAIEALYHLKDQISEYYDNAIRAINDIPDASEFAQDADTVINEEIAQPVMEQADGEAQRVSEAIVTMESVIEEYVSELEEYDALSYLEMDKIQEYLSSMYTTISDMEAEIMEQDNAYMEYIYEVTTTADENVKMLQESLDESYEGTQENVLNIMDGFKQNRKELNEQNVLLLSDITAKLPYTRLGNLEYTQVYDFIVEPVIVSDESEIKTRISPTSISMDWQDLVCMFIGIIALIIIDLSVYLIHKRYQLKAERGEEEWQTEFR